MTFCNVNKISSFLIFIRNYCKQNGEKNSGSIWSYFKADNTEKKVSPLEADINRRKREEQLPQFGGTAYRTCGSAYIVQKKYIPTKDIQKSKEDSILEKIETDLSIKNNLEDPMPPFQSVEQRMLDLAERRLHPFYKRYLSMARPMNIEEDKNTLELRQPYKCKSGPIQLEDIPAHLKLSKEVLETKNIFADFKGVELPKQMLAKIIEIEENRKPTLEKGSKKENKNDK